MDGNVDGSIIVGAINSGDSTIYAYQYAFDGVESYAYTYAQVNVGGDVDQDITISANNSGSAFNDSADYSDAAAYALVVGSVNVSGDVSGSITIDATNTGDAGSSVDYSYNYAYTIIAGAELDANLYIDGNVCGDISLTSVNSGEVFNLIGQEVGYVVAGAFSYGNITVNGTLYGDISVGSSNDTPTGNAYSALYASLESLGGNQTLDVNAAGGVEHSTTYAIDNNLYGYGYAYGHSHFNGYATSLAVINVEGTADSSFEHVELRAGSTFDSASAYIFQTDKTTDVDVNGEGRVTLGAYSTAGLGFSSINLDDLGGTFDLKLYDASIAPTVVPGILQNITTIDGFNASKDSINLRINPNLENSVTELDNIATSRYYDADSTINAYSRSVALGVFVSQAVDSFASNSSASTEISYYFATYGGNGYLAYGLSGGGNHVVQGIIELTGITELPEIVLANQFNVDLTNTGENYYDISSDTAISTLSADDSGDSRYTYLYASSDTTLRIDHIDLQSNAFSFAYTDISGDLGTLELRQADINVMAYNYSYSYVVIEDAHGGIGAISLNADNLASVNFDLINFDGELEQLDVNLGNYSQIYADIQLNDFVHLTNITSHSDYIYSYTDITIDQSIHGGSVFVNEYGTAADIQLTYVDQVADEIYLGTTYNDGNGDGYGRFEGSSTLNLHFGVADKDLYVSYSDDYGLGQLKEEMLTIHGATLSNIDLYFNDDQEVNEYYDITTSLGLTLSDLDEFIGLAATKIHDGGYDYVFGVVGEGDNETGYLAYDSDNTGITMLIEFDNLTAFSASLIHNNVIV